MFLKMNDGAAILLTFVILLVTIGLGALFLFFIRRNIAKEKEESEVIVENAITKRAMEDSIRNYIKKVDRFGAMTLMYVDVDGFGDLNEVFGREACDQILKEMAARILRALPYKATLCKYVNDEFLIFVKDEDNRARIDKLASQLNDVINNPYQVLIGESIRLTASIGVVTYPIAGDNFEDLYANLQLTTYVSKRDGGNKFTSFYASIKEEETDNMMYYQEIKRAIANKEFVLYYQPIVNLGEKTMAGAEALMRWNHPTKGVQAPSTFLKVLEQSGDIKWVGEWGIETMIKIRNLMAERFPTIPLRFSLNLSTKQLLDSNLANKFIDIMNKNNAKPENYQLEISDFMMVERIAVIKTNIFKLRDYGFKIAVDGFELDGQSVQNIQRSPVDVIKLGRSFLRDIENNFMKERLLQILVKFATDNNKTLVCEGIETAEVAKYVKEQNVFMGQGYFFAKPMSQEAFLEYVERHQYKVLLDDVSALEDNEELLKVMGEVEEVVEYIEVEESAEDLLARTVLEYEEVEIEE
ncbi:MAG: bifunctional diguanylate cyclase/phosphodiesterase [Acholeplasmatales bacterium]|nr:bifunctional diguanylate cyclase/phosphodiesterase [Acholeplasmatales bacterium]